jgi:DNA polymerase I-like protein with 3'-5' exonuclease and polymerase domains
MSDWDDEQYIAFDFETSGKLPEYGLQPWRLRTGEAWITSLAWVYRENGETKRGGTIDPDPLYIACFLAWAIESGRTLVGWNVQFDIQWLLALGLDNHVHQCRFVDGMLVWRHLEIEPEYETTRVSKKSYSLKTAVREHLPQYAGYEDQIDFHSTDPADRVKLHTYNIQDCLFTLRITKKLYEQLKARQRQAMWIEAQCLAMVAKANVEGMLLDTTYAQWLSKVNRDVAAKKLALLAPHGVTEAVVRSPKQLQVLMYDVWKLPVLKETTSAKTGTVSRSTDKTVLHELAFIDVRAKELRAYREALNNDTKFAITPIRSVQYCGDGMSHPNARVFGTYSGRMTYSSKQGKGVTERPTGFALHQMPRMSEKQPLDFRAQVIAPKGYTIVEFDAAGQEFRWMAMAANDLTMLQLCQPGEDAHSFMGAKIARMDYKEFLRRLALKEQHIKDGRQMGKIANLCIAKGEIVLTDRGPCSIELVKSDDLVWDGEAFVAHDGVSFSGERWTIDNDGVMATPSHQVLVSGAWTAHDETQRMGWAIDRACAPRHALRIVGGIARRAVREAWRDLRAGALRLWDRARSQPAVHGDRTINHVQGLRYALATSAEWRPDRDRRGDATLAEASQRMVSTMLEPEGSLMAKLWGAWDRVSVLISGGSRGIHQTNSAASHVPQTRHRPARQRGSLRAWKLALGYAQSEPRKSAQVETYDIVNCGPRTRYAINGRIVHNSLQYRTSAKKLRVVARVDYDVPMTMTDAYFIHDLYRTTYWRVPEYWDRQIALTMRRQWVETFAGRRVQVKGDWNGKNGWSMGSTAINYRIQGTGADQKYLAMMMMRDYIHTIGARFFLDLHDGIYLLVPDRLAKSAAKHIKKELDNLPYAQTWNFIPPIPLPWDCKMGKTWGGLKEFKP